MIERPVVSVRRLGGSDMTDVTNTTTLFASGKNIKPAADTVRRTILCNLDAKIENPENRQFDFVPVEMIKKDRGAYVRAALMVVKAYRDAGLPDKKPRLASFEAWSDNVRSALVWLGKADPVETQKVIAEADPEKERLGIFLAAWKATGINNKTAGELKAEAIKLNNANMGGAFENEHPLWAALIEVAGERGAINTLRLAKYLSRFKGRIVNGLKIVSSKDAVSNQNRYSVE